MFTEKYIIMNDWVTVHGYEGIYQINSSGNIKSLKRVSINRNGPITLKEKILKPSLSAGYLLIGLRVNKVRKSFRLNRLVAIHFIPNPLNLPEVNHLDGDKTNNNYLNLVWSTAKENTIHAHKNGLVRYNYGRNHYKSIPVVKCDKYGVEIKFYENARFAACDGFYPSMVHRASRGTLKSGHLYKGYYWYRRHSII